MGLILVWFVMTNGSGYIEPLTVQRPQMRCGLAGEAIGVTVDRPVNPTLVRWPDPTVTGQHCEVDIGQRVAALAHGEYHLATTIVGKDVPFGTPVEGYIGHDPHTSAKWLRSVTSPGLPGKPANFRVTKDGQ